MIREEEDSVSVLYIASGPQYRHLKDPQIITIAPGGGWNIIVVCSRHYSIGLSL